MKSLKCFLRLCLLANLIFLLGACSTTQQYVGGRATLPDTLEKDQGVVLIKVIGVQRLGMLNAKFTGLTVVDPAGQFFTLGDFAPRGASYSLFVGRLPANRYTINRFEAVGVNTMGLLWAALTTDSLSLSEERSRFSVKQGAVTNLGTVIFSFSEDKAAKSEVAFVSTEAGLGGAMDGLDAKLQARLQNLEKLGWDSTPNTDSNGTALDRIRKSSRMLSSPAIDKDGRFLIGGPLGRVYQRDLDGRWQTYNVGILDTINFVTPLKNGRLFAATDAGYYFVSNTERSSWTRFSLPKRESTIGALYEADDGACYLHLAGLGEEGGKYYDYIYHLRQLGGADGYTLLMDRAKALGEGMLHTFFDGEKIHVYFNFFGFSRHAELRHVSINSPERTTTDVPFWTFGIYRLADGNVMLHRMNGMSLFPALSKDNGHTWEHLETSGPDNMRFVDSRKGYGLTLLHRGWNTITVALNKTEDGGRSWKALGQPLEIPGGSTLHVLGRGEILIFGADRMLTSRDEGQTWEHTWPL